MAHLVSLAKAAPTPEGYGPAYDLLRPHFDHGYYFASNPNIARAKLDPLAHYIRVGEKEGRNPTAWFSVGAYLERVPEADGCKQTAFGHWITYGKGQRILAAPFDAFETVTQQWGLDPFDVWTANAATAKDVQDRLRDGPLAEAVSAAAHLEPLINDSLPAATRPRIVPFTGDRVLGRSAAFHDIIAAAEYKAAKTVVLSDGHNDVLSGFAPLGLASALATRNNTEDVISLVMAAPAPQQGFKLPKGLRQVHLEGLEDLAHPEDKQRTMADTLRSFAPDHIIIFESPRTRKFVQIYGKHLKADAQVSMVLDQSAHKGPPYDLLGYVSTLVTSAAHKDWLDGFVTPVPLPIASLPVCPPCPATPKAGITAAGPIAAAVSDRSSWQADRILRLARQLPDYEFVLLVPDMTTTNTRVRYFPTNVRLEAAHPKQLFALFETALCWLDGETSGDLEGLAMFAACSGLPVMTSRSKGQASPLIHGLHTDDPDAVRAAVERLNGGSLDLDEARAQLTKRTDAAAHARLDLWMGATS